MLTKLLVKYYQQIKQKKSFLSKIKLEIKFKIKMLTILHAIGLYELILIIIGTIGNLSVFLASLKLKNNTFILIRFLAIADTIALYFWNLNHFTNQFFHLDLQNFNFYFCKFFQFSQYTSLQISAWILVTIIQ